METIPRFFLYGEAEIGTDLRFFHVETIAARSRLHDWRIAPHRHADLFQILLIRSGLAEVQLDATLAAHPGPVLIVVPATGVHGFRFQPDTEGWVLSMAAGFAAEIAGPGQYQEDLSNQIAPAILKLNPADLDAHRLVERFHEIETEYRWSAYGRPGAIAALVRLLFIALARLTRDRAGDTSVAAPDRALFGRFRTLIEARFREHLPVGAYAELLSVTERRLASASRQAVGRAPQAVIHDRLLLEAKRSLIYTGLTVAEIAYGLGFDDPAYFSRFFTRLTGLPPRAFQRQSSSNGSPT